MNKLIAIVGMAGSGKSVATDYLLDKGFNKVYFGGAIIDKLKEDGLEVTPVNEKKYREDVRKKYGMAAVAILLEDKIRASYEEKDTVLDGLYSWDEYVYLKEKFKNLKLVCVCCDKDKRYERISTREVRPFKGEEIVVRDVSEIENLAKGGPIAYADYYILNNGTVDEYIERLLEILKDIERHEGE